MRRLPLALSLALLVACQQATSPTSATPTAATAAATPAFAFEEATIDQARAIVLDWCYGFYNHDRRHSTIGMLSPINYETSTAVPAGEAA